MHRTSQQCFGRKVWRQGVCTVFGVMLIVMPGMTAPPTPADDQTTPPDQAATPAGGPDDVATADEPDKAKNPVGEPVSPRSLWEQLITGKTPVVPLDPVPAPVPGTDPSEAPLPVGGENGDDHPTLFTPQDQRIPAIADVGPPRVPIHQEAITEIAPAADDPADGVPQAPRAPVPSRFLGTPVNGGLEADVDSNDRFTGSTVPVVDPEISPATGLEATTAQSTHGWLSKGRLVLRLTTGVVFDDNAELRAHDRRSDFILTLSPSITYVLGSSGARFSLVANYTAVGLYFLEGTSKNSVDHSGNITTAYHFNQLTLGGTFSVRSSDGSNRDAGDRVRQTVFYLGAFADCSLTEKISLSANGDLSSSSFSRLLDSQEARLQLFVDFAVRPKVQLGAGFLFGVLGVDRGPTQTYEQFLTRVALTPTAKLGFNGSLGVEVRQLGDGVSDEVSPVFSAGAYYNPWANVTFSLDARYRTYPSTALGGEDYQAFTLGLGVRRANILDRFNVSLNFGFEQDRYEETVRDVLADRRDSFFYTQLGVGWSLKKYCSLSAFYEFSVNESRGSGSQHFERNRVGLFLNFLF